MWLVICLFKLVGAYIKPILDVLGRMFPEAYGYGQKLSLDKGMVK